MNINKIFRNANIQSICEFLIHGTGVNEPDNRPYSIRLKEAREQAVCKFKAFYPNSVDYDNATEELDLYAAEIQSVYMEIGVQTGLLIAFQVCEKMICGGIEDD